MVVAIKSWNIKLEKCPHCGEGINIDFTSYKSEKDMIDNFFLRMNFHLKNQCYDKVIPKVHKVNSKNKDNNLTTYEKVNLYF